MSVAPFTVQGGTQVFGLGASAVVNVHEPLAQMRLQTTTFLVNTWAEFILVPPPGKFSLNCHP